MGSKAKNGDQEFVIRHGPTGDGALLKAAIPKQTRLLRGIPQQTGEPALRVALLPFDCR